jgi:hypothetical protein
MNLRRASGAALVAAALLGGCGGGHHPKPPPKAPAGPAKGTVGPPPDAPALAVGITEQNPNFISPGPVPGVFAHWRDELAKLHPAYYRLVVDWASLQPEPGKPPVFDSPNDGCLRDKPPCGGYGGLRSVLKALGERQRADGGWQALVVPAGTPAWAAAPASGCERPGTLPRSRPPRPGDGMKAYGDFVRALLDEARRDRVDLHYWAPWNEPNHPFFISPQRDRCAASARSAAVGPYVDMARTLEQALDEAPGEQELVLGELAGLPERRPKSASVSEFIGDMPDDLACGVKVWTQHGYLGGVNPVDDVERALQRKGCAKPAIWITETGVGAPRRGEKRRTSFASQVSACRLLHERLTQWYDDDRVTVAFQYTFREDDIFPTGLVKTDLSDGYPALSEWAAWGGTARPKATDPPPPDSCSQAAGDFAGRAS